MFTEAHGTGKMCTKLSRPPFFHSKNLPNLVKEKSHLVVSPSEEHYHCEIHAERGPHETQARDLSPVIYN